MQTDSQGLSLTEMLTVIAIIGVIWVLLVPAFQNFNSSQKVEAAATRLAAELALARVTAVSQNTYTWLAIAYTDPGNDRESLKLAVFRSNDGTATADADSLSLVSRVSLLADVRLTANGAIHPDLMRSESGNLIWRSIGGKQLPSSSGLGSVATITFTPQGQCLLKSEPESRDRPTPLIEIVLSPSHGDPVSSQQTLVEVRGATGTSRLVRIQ